MLGDKIIVVFGNVSMSVYKGADSVALEGPNRCTIKFIMPSNVIKVPRDQNHFCKNTCLGLNKSATG